MNYGAEPIYLLSSGHEDPAWNMAVDDCLLDACNRGRLEGTWIRLFGWAPAALSLGRTQAAEAELDPGLLLAAGVPVVRRSTGGRAVYHAEELTYSIVGALADPTWGDSLHATYRVATSLVAAGLAELGIETALAPERPPAAAIAASDLRAACFAVAYGHELCHRGRKICGSAQRRLTRAFLQHGSVLLGPGHARLADWVRTDRDRTALRRRLLADTIDVGRALGRAVEHEEVAGALTRSLRSRFGGRLSSAALPATIAAAARAREPMVRVDLGAAVRGAAP